MLDKALPAMLNIIDELPGYIAWKDENSHYLGCNRNLASLYGFSYLHEIVGMKDQDLGELPEELISFYHDCDKLELTGKTVRLIHDSHDSNKLFFLEKKPLFNDKNIIVGSIFQCNELTENIIFDIKKRDSKYGYPSLKAYKVGSFENPFELSARELECLFCLLRGMTAKRIAEVLHLSKRTIEFYIANIKNKLGSLTKSELMVLSIQHGYMDIIPPRFINSNLQELFS